MTRQHRLVAAVVTIALGALAAHHLYRGFYYLAVEQPATAAADYYNRRLDNAYFLDRVSPQSQNFLYWSKTDPSLSAFATGADPAQRHGGVIYSGLPPWTYALQLGVFLPSSDRFGRVYLASLDVAALAVVVSLAYAEARRHGADPLGRAVVVLGVLAIGATNATLMSGQIGLLVNSGLALVLMALSRPADWRWDVLGGAGLALAMFKPSSALLFVLPPLMARRMTLLVTCGVILAGGWIASAWWVHLPALVQLRQFEQATRFVVSQGANVWLSALARVSSAAFARNLFLVLGAIAAAAAAYKFRDQPSASFALVAIASRLFTYHRAYDDVLLAFVVIYLGARAASASGEPRQRALWIALGVSLWLPYSLYMSPTAQVGQSLCWLGAGALLLSRRPFTKMAPLAAV